MPGLYGNSNAYVIGTDTIGLYGTNTSNVLVSNVSATNTTGLYTGLYQPLPTSAQVIYGYFENTGNVQFVLDANTGNNKIYAYTTIVPNNYGNSDVAGYLPIYSGNINAAYYTGNGAYLTGLPTQYSNANVAAYLPTYQGILNTTGITTGNIADLYFIGNSGIDIYSSHYAQLQWASNLANATAYGGSDFNWIYVDQDGVHIDNNAKNGIATSWRFGIDGNLLAGGNILLANSLHAAYLYGNGYNLTLPVQSGTYSNSNVASYLTSQSITPYSNSNVASYLPTYSGNINAAYFIGNGYALTLPVQSGTYSNANVAGYLVANPQAGTYSNSNVASYLTSQSITPYSNANVAGYLVANPQSGTYSNSNVASYLPTYTGNIKGQYANLTANVTANYFIGNGYALTLPTQSGTYSNSNVASYLPTYSGNVNAAYFTGNGSLLTGIVSGSTYSNSNVASYLPTYTGNLAGQYATLTANVQAAYFIGNGYALTLPTQTGTYSNSNVAGYLIANPQSGTYSNSNVAGYLPTYSGLIGGTLTTAAQPNITSVGTLTSLNSSGIIAISNTTQATSTTTGALTVQGGAGFLKDVYIGGNLFVTNLNSINTQILTVTAPLLYLSSNVVYPYTYDVGMYSHFVGGSGNTYGHTGLVRNYVDNTWYLFSNIPDEPSGNIINLASPNIVYDKLKTGSITSSGNVTATYYYGNGAYLTGVGGASSAAQGYYLSAHDTTTQYANSATTAYQISINTLDINNGITLTGNNLVFSYSGTYNIQFSAQIQNTDTSSAHEVYIWARQNGVDVPSSNGQITIPTKHAAINGQALVSWNYIVNVNAGDTFGLWWASDAGTSQITIQTLTALSSPTMPDIPAVIITAQQVTNVQLANATVVLAGDITGTGNVGNTITTTLSSTGVTAATYGNATYYPQFTVAANGRITSASSIIAYSNSNVASYLPTYSGNITAGNITATHYGNSIGTTATYSGNITANYFIGNGYALTLPVQTGTYSNSNVASYLTANPQAGTYSNSNVASYLTANPQAGTYSNTNAAAYFASTPTTNISISGSMTVVSGPFATGNVTAYYYTGTGVDVTGQVNTTGSFTGQYANLTANVSANYFKGNGSLLTGISSGSTYSNANVAGYLPTYSGNISANYYTGNGYLLTGITSGSTYSNANVAGYLPTYTGNVNGSYGIFSTQTLGPAAKFDTIAGYTGTASTLTGRTTEVVYSIGTAGGSQTPNMNNGSVQKITLNSALTLNAPSNMNSGDTMTIIITGGTAYTSITQGTGTWKWAYGDKTLTGTTGAIDIVTIFYDGTTYYASVNKGFQ